MDKKDLTSLIEELNEKFHQEHHWFEIWQDRDILGFSQLCVDISWGDWKHEHLHADYVIEEMLKEKGYELFHSNTSVTEEDGSDCYSAIHRYFIR